MQAVQGERPLTSGSAEDTRSIGQPIDPATDVNSGLGLLVSSQVGTILVPLRAGTFVLGRAPDVDVPIGDGSISRRHARLRIDDTGVTLEDLGSTNGTTVQGRKLERGERAQVSVGTVFELGCAALVVERVRDLQAIAPEAGAGGSVSASSPPPEYPDAPLVFDPTVRHIYALLDVVAPTLLPVLVLGEPGVGKDVYAKAVHQRSDRRAAPFLTARCGALSEGEIEHELFGRDGEPGLLEAASGGTIYLDEVGELSIATQARLVRVLESSEVTRGAAREANRIDVRVVASTCRDLRQLIVEGRFRSDLYFRLHGMGVTLPPLRKRAAEIGLIAALLLDRAAARAGRASTTLTDAAIEALERHHWPGNVRELRETIERALGACRTATVDVQELMAADPEVFETEEHDERTDRYELPAASRRMIRAAIPRPSSAPTSVAPDETERLAAGDLRSELRTLEKQRIVDALTKTQGNQSQAAKLLGMSRYTLMSRLETYGIARPRKSRA